MTFLSSTNAFKHVIQHAHESSGLIVFILSFLSICSIFSGFLLKEFFIAPGSIFLGNSIFILPHHFNLFEAEFLPMFIKVIPLAFSLSGAFLAFLLNDLHNSFLVFLKKESIGASFYTFFNQRWFLDRTYNVYFFKPGFHLSYLISFKLFDKGFIELIGPLGIFLSSNNFSKRISTFQSGLIYHYTFIVLTGVFFYMNLIFFFNLINTYFSFEVLVYYFFILLSVLL